VKNGCYDLELKDRLVVQVGWHVRHVGFDGAQKEAIFRSIPNRMSKECQYSVLTPNDPSCVGCKRYRGGNTGADSAAPRAPHGANGVTDEPSIDPKPTPVGGLALLFHQQKT